MKQTSTRHAVDMSPTDGAQPINPDVGIYRMLAERLDQHDVNINRVLGLTESLHSDSYNGDRALQENGMTTTHLGFSDRFALIITIIGTGVAIIASMYAYADAKFEAQEAEMKTAVSAVETIAKDIRRDFDGFQSEMVAMRKDLNHQNEINELKMELLKQEAIHSRSKTQ